MAEFNLEGLLGNAFGGGSGNFLDEYLSPEQRAAMQRNAMLAASAALLKAGGESTRRIGIGEALGSAFEAGQAGYEKAQTGALTQMALKQKLDEAKKAKDLQKLIAGVFAPQAPVDSMLPPSAPGPMPKVGDTYTHTFIEGDKAGTSEQRKVTQEDLAAVQNYKGPQVQLPSSLTAPAQAAARPMNANIAMANQYRQVAKMLAENGQIEQAMKSVDMALKLDPPANLSEKTKLLSELGLPPTIANLRLLDKPEGPSEKTKLLGELGLAPTVANLRLLEKPEGLSEKTKLLAELGLPPTIANLRLLEKPQNVDKAPRTQQVTLDDGTIGLINMDTGVIIPSTVGGVAAKGKVGALTESQSNAFGFAQRMERVNGILAPLEAAGSYPGFGSAVAGALPFVGGITQRTVQSPDVQRYQQAASDWIRAKLRKESGAAIGVDEAKQEYATYFPMPNDSTAVIEQKRQARIVATEAMKMSAGKTYTPPAPVLPGAGGSGLTWDPAQKKFVNR